MRAVSFRGGYYIDPETRYSIKKLIHLGPQILEHDLSVQSPAPDDDDDNNNNNNNTNNNTNTNNNNNNTNNNNNNNSFSPKSFQDPTEIS